MSNNQSVNNSEKNSLDSFDSIQRCPHDKENPYTMVLNSLIRDNSISPNCRWLIIYLLSNKEGWNIKVSQIVKNVKKFIGRDSVYHLINEAIDSGYMYREEFNVNGLKRYKYYLSENKNLKIHTEKQKLKKCLPYPDPQDTDPPYTENQYSKESTKKEITSKEKTLTQSSSSLECCPKKETKQKCNRVDDDDIKRNLKDLDMERGQSSDVEVVKTNGTKLVMSQSVIYSHFAKKAYATEIIQEAINRIRQVQGPVNNILKYLESTCESILREQEIDKNSFTKTKKPKKEYAPSSRPIEHVETVVMGDYIKKKNEEKRLAEEKKRKELEDERNR